MATVLYSASASLDGFIAGPDGDMSWLSEHLGPNPVADALLPRIGSLLVGARTYGGDDPNRGTDSEGAFGGAWSGPQVVLTSTPPAEPVPGTTFVSDLREAVALASELAGDRYVDVLGAQTAKGCLDAGLLDEVLVFVVPVLLGDGTRLFDHPGGTRVRLEQVEVTPLPHCTAVRLRVVR